MTTETAPRPSEGQHWYTANGVPFYEVQRSDGKGMRPATLRDARKLALLPGVSSIIRCAAAPGLDEWKITQNLLAFATLPEIAGESLDARIVRVRADAKAQAEKARDNGTAIHASVQGYYDNGIYDAAHSEHVLAAVRAIDDTFGMLKWVAEMPFADPFNGFGGKIDLHTREGEGVILDVKTKEFDKVPVEGYDEQCMQLAAYRQGFLLPTARCANVFVSTSKPGLAYVHEWTDAELKRGWEMFQSLLLYWKAKNSYDGGTNQ